MKSLISYKQGTDESQMSLNEVKNESQMSHTFFANEVPISCTTHRLNDRPHVVTNTT